MALEAGSASRPIRAAKIFDVNDIAGFVNAARSVGAVHITHAPGLQSSLTKWHRNLADDVSRLADVYGTTMLVSLVTAKEAQLIAIEHEAELADSLGIAFESFPIPNGGVPPVAMDVFASFIAKLLDFVRSGTRMVIHCRAGFGRAGLVAACLVLAANVAPSASEAIERVRSKRKAAHTQAVETREQEEFIAAFESHLRG